VWKQKENGNGWKFFGYLRWREKLMKKFGNFFRDFPGHLAMKIDFLMKKADFHGQNNLSFH
jgi:hypothetical protein